MTEPTALIARLRAMVAAPVTRWAVIIWPEWYDDADDTGYGWEGEAKDEADAVAQACRECDADNGHAPAFVAEWGDHEWDVTGFVLAHWSVGTIRKHFDPKDWTNHADPPTPEQLDGLRQAATAPASVRAWAGPLPVILNNVGHDMPTDPAEVKVIDAGPDWRGAYEALAAAIKAEGAAERPDVWHVGELPGDNCMVVRDENGLTVKEFADITTTRECVRAHNAELGLNIEGEPITEGERQ